MFALLMKKKFSIGYDWADLIIIITAFLIFMYGQIQSSDDPFLAIFSRLQSGAYIIFIGLLGSLFYLISASCQSKEKLTNEKKIQIMANIEGVLAIFGGLFVTTLLFGYFKDFFIKWNDNFIKDFFDNLSLIGFSLFSFCIVEIAIFSLTRIIFYIIDKKTVNYWRKQEDWTLPFGGLYNKSERKKENDATMNKYKEAVKSKIELNENEKKIMNIDVIGNTLLIFFSLFFASFLFTMFYGFIPFKYGFIGNLCAVVISLVSLLIGVFIMFKLTRLIIYIILDKKTYNDWREMSMFFEFKLPKKNIDTKGDLT